MDDIRSVTKKLFDAIVTDLDVGESNIKWTKQVLWYTKVVVFMVKRL